MGCTVLVARNYQSSNLVRLLPLRPKIRGVSAVPVHAEAFASHPAVRQETNMSAAPDFVAAAGSETSPACSWSEPQPDEIDPLYLFACELEWERRSETGSGWEVISAAGSANSDTRAHAHSLLERSLQVQARFEQPRNSNHDYERNSTMEAGMRTPYGLDIIESCMGCKASRDGFFCRFSPNVLRSVDAASHHTIMPPGAVLFVEGQTPRGVFVLCSGKVKLSTTSKEGKVLILKQAEAGDVLGLSAAISCTNYEMTAETATACQLNFVGRRDLMALLQNHSEVGTHAAQWLSREFQSAYRDMHELVLARSSSGKLARLLLSCAPRGVQISNELHLRSIMTHEEMAQRIGSSRETVTRLLSHLKKKRLIRLEGATLIIRDRTGLEALAV